ncbi:MAG: dihydrofolate reductase [Proteobacteria bacterium]|nr:dihydrofolate reductase [Pseudomonadota bacterium]
MRISLIAAASANNVIGNRGELPWHLPRDLKRFKEVTTGKPSVIGHCQGKCSGMRRTTFWSNSMRIICPP